MVPNAPTPHLRIVPTDALYPHEEPDSQRLLPLIERLRQEEFVINPPVVAPMDTEHYVVLDGANRCNAFQQLGYPHSLVQIVTYDSGYVDLLTWRHVISQWTLTELLAQLEAVPGVLLREDPDDNAVGQLYLRDGTLLSVHIAAENVIQRSAALCQIVQVYQRNARLNRTALQHPAEIWRLYSDAIALVTFPVYQPQDIITAARQHAYLPPGITRHIVQGRALRVNYSIALLRDPHQTTEAKNKSLESWFQRKLANRHVRYYAEATYQFDE